MLCGMLSSRSVLAPYSRARTACVPPVSCVRGHGVCHGNLASSRFRRCRTNAQLRPFPTTERLSTAPCSSKRAVCACAAKNEASTSVAAPLSVVQEYFLGLPWRKLLPLAVIFSFATFNYTVLQMLKDSFVVIAGGAEALPFLMSLGVLPASVAFFLYYGKLVSKLPAWAVFYASVAPLLAFYSLFAVVLYPIADTLHPTAWMMEVQKVWPEGLHGLLKAVCNWTYSLFFCFAELWGSVVISVLFWTLANDVCTVDEAKTVYPLMGISANLALVLAGQYVKHVNVNWAVGNQHTSLLILVGTILATSVAMMGAKGFVDNYIAVPADKVAANPMQKKKKPKGSFKESLEVLRGSEKIRNLALLVIGYGLGHRLFEFAWKGQLRLICPSVTSYQNMLADVSSWTGALTIFFMLTSRFLFQAGWVIAACGTPLVLLITGSLFFGASLAAQSQLSLGLSPAALATFGVFVGCVTQVFARSSKYSLFDPAKEMVYIEMDRQEKTRGKAAVDLVGSQIGKSGASWLTQAALLVSGSLSQALPFLSLCFVLVTMTWIRATIGLSQLMKREKADAAIAADAAAAESAPPQEPSSADGPAAPLLAPGQVGLSNGAMYYSTVRRADPQASQEETSTVSPGPEHVGGARVGLSNGAMYYAGPSTRDTFDEEDFPPMHRKAQQGGTSQSATNSNGNGNGHGLPNGSSQVHGMGNGNGMSNGTSNPGVTEEPAKQPQRAWS